jgi:hypothetical protein
MATPRCRNLLRTESGLVWNDLEDVCAGPVAWDVAGLVTSARTRGHSATFIDELLAAYGDPGVDDLEAFLEAHACMTSSGRRTRADVDRRR